MSQAEETTITQRWGKPDATHDPYALAHFQPRPSDILITTAPKAGTTWMQQILHQLRSGGDDSFSSIYDVVPWLELPHAGKSWSEVLTEYEALPDPRIFKTHCTYPQTPGSDVVRIILTSRDPRDCCLSFYHHKMNMTDAAREKFGIQAPASFDAFLDEWLAFGSWYRNVRSWWPHRHDANVLWLRYEDIRHDLNAGLERILSFLGWHIDEQQRARILQLCSFEWMKQHAERFSNHGGDNTPTFKPGAFIRKGQVGEGKIHLSAAQEQRILDQARASLSPDCLAFFDITP